MSMSFIFVHQDSSPIIINVSDISYVKGNQIFLRSRKSGDTHIAVDESFDVIINTLCKELKNEQSSC